MSLRGASLLVEDTRAVDLQRKHWNSFLTGTRANIFPVKIIHIIYHGEDCPKQINTNIWCIKKESLQVLQIYIYVMQFQ